MTGKIPAQVAFEGEWSLEKAEELQKVLAATLCGLLQAEPRPEVAEVTMAEVSDIDACGCQLLAVFLENVRRHGMTPVTCGTSEALADKICQLGFQAIVQPEAGRKGAL